MNLKTLNKTGLKLLLAVLLLAVLAFGPLEQGIQRFKTIYTDYITVNKDLTVRGDITLTDDMSLDDLTVTGDTALGDAADDTATVTGDMVLNGVPDTDTANYNNWFEITGNMTGTGTKDRNYGLVIEMTRPAGQELTNGDHDEAGLKIRVDTEAVTTTAGTVLRAIDAEAKADNPGGTVTNLYGAAVTAKSDTSAGDVGTMVALTTNAQANAQVDDEMGAADFRLFRQSATEPTSEYVVKVRNGSTSGTGADAGILMTSDYAGSAVTDAMDYGLDMDTAAVTTADIRLSNGETISNVTDTAVQISGFVAMDVGATQDLTGTFTLTPTASYQPVTNSTGGSITSDTSTAIADGAVAGALLVICNEDAQDVVIKDGANTVLSGDLTLTGGANDCLTVLWNGTNWVGLSLQDN